MGTHGETNNLLCLACDEFLYLTMAGSFNAIVNAKYNKCLFVIEGNAFCFLSSLLASSCVLVLCLV